MTKHLNTLWQVVNAASTVADFARQSQTFTFSVPAAATVYLRAEQADVRIVRWALPKVDVFIQLQAAFGWRVATDQDADGVYVVAKRRMVVGKLSKASFTLSVPHDAYLILKLEDSNIVLTDVDGTLHVPPRDAQGQLALPGTTTK
ncbi:MAG: hypothetical protein LCI00_12160 [Chloroflexi bacterium]|nr:hypothetical protein [Chloroflexota bacterium]MCC6896238.1 hypothetical protein [Anaerolineae bacterium]